jgi:hypothetical protein
MKVVKLESIQVYEKFHEVSTDDPGAWDLSHD